MVSGEKIFNRMYNVKSEDLMKKYRLTPEKVEMLETVLLPEEIKPLNEFEKSFIENEYKIGKNL